MSMQLFGGPLSFETIREEFHHQADFAYVGCTMEKTQQERCQSAEYWHRQCDEFLKDQEMPVMEVPWVVDGMGKQLSLAYDAHPFQLYIILSGNIIFRSRKEDPLESLAALRESMTMRIAHSPRRKQDSAEWCSPRRSTATNLQGRPASLQTIVGISANDASLQAVVGSSGDDAYDASTVDSPCSSDSSSDTSSSDESEIATMSRTFLRFVS